MDVFAALAAERKLVKGTSSKPGGVDYSSRKDRGKVRAIYNEGVQRLPGSFNPEAKVEIKVNGVQPYDFMNLTAQARTQALQDQFEVVENIMKTQLRVEGFEDFFSPI